MKVNTKAFSRRIRFWFWITKAYIVKKAALIAVIIILISGIFALLFKGLPLIIGRDIYTHAVVGNYKISEVPPEILSLATRGLTRVDENGQVKPDIAIFWKVSDDKKTFTFQIDKNISWQDGQKVTIDDFVDIFPRVKSKVVSEDTIEYQLDDPLASFPTVAAAPIFRKGTYAGTGAYKLTEIKEVEQIVKELHFTKADNRFKRLIVEFFPNRESAYLAYKQGRVKSTEVFNPNPFINWPNVNNINYKRPTRLVAAFFNTKDVLLGDKKVRQALNHLIQKDFISGGILATGPIPSTSWTYSENVKKYEYDVKKAEELLKDLDKSIEKKITISTTRDYEDIAKQIAEDWTAGGFNVEIKNVRGLTDSFQVIVGAQNISSDPDQYSLWHSTQVKTNLTQLSNVRIDKLLEDGRQTIAQSARQQQYNEFQKYLVDEAPAVFLYFPDKQISVIKKHFSDLEEILKTNNFLVR